MVLDAAQGEASKKPEARQGGQRAWGAREGCLGGGAERPAAGGRGAEGGSGRASGKEGGGKSERKKGGARKRADETGETGLGDGPQGYNRAKRSCDVAPHVAVGANQESPGDVPVPTPQNPHVAVGPSWNPMGTTEGVLRSVLKNRIVAVVRKTDCDIRHHEPT